MAFEQVASAGFTAIPDDGDWIATMALLCETCAVLGDARRAHVLYDALLPHADVIAVAGLGVAVLGPVARVLGKLASTLGRAAEASRHFERALAVSAGMDATALAAHAQLDYASALGGGSHADELVTRAQNVGQQLGLTAVLRKASRVNLS